MTIELVIFYDAVRTLTTYPVKLIDKNISCKKITLID